MVCRVCGVQNIVGEDGRCRGCRIAKMATDMGKSYGVLEAVIWDRFGDQVQTASGPSLTCPVCGRLFLPKTSNQKYDSNACAVKAAQAAYRNRKRTQALGAPVEKRKEPICSSSDASTVGASTPKQSIPEEADMIPTPSGRGRTG